MFVDAVVACACAIADVEQPRPLVYVSLFSGFFDTYLGALRKHGLRVSAHAAAEKDADAQAVLAQAHGYDEVYTSAVAAAVRVRQADIVSWTPSCKPVSPGAALGPKSTARKQRSALLAVRRDARTLAALLQRCSPRLVLGEQVEGLLTCYPLARAALLMIMQPLPYVWFWRCIDAWDRGAPSHRRRIGIVACRCDCLRLCVARAAAGAAGRCDCGRAVKGWCRRCEAE